jgi:hypothetical protein
MGRSLASRWGLAPLVSPAPFHPTGLDGPVQPREAEQQVYVASSAVTARNRRARCRRASRVRKSWERWSWINLRGQSAPASTSYGRLQVPCQRTTQNKADDRDDECPEKRRDEFVHTEAKAHALRDPTGQKQHERVDDEDEQAQGDDFQW